MLAKGGLLGFSIEEGETPANNQGEIRKEMEVD